jgi:hypothetical protein
MQLRRLDLFLHISDEESVYSTRLTQNAMGTIPPPPLDRDGSEQAAIDIIETISKAQIAPLERLTLHLARTGYQDRAQPYVIQSTMQLRRTATGDYDARGNYDWSWGMQLKEDLFYDQE